ncbi:MAG: PBP1A family penicillin-binding protein [Lachnospiraceae bacterium]|nr:PBP1A family penicillin-binding protein [Lachnospiraceae bacterium]
MNYGRKAVKRKKDLLIPRGLWVGNRIKATVFLIVLILAVGAAGYGVHWAYEYVQEILEEAPDISAVDATPTGYMSTVYDADGNVTAQLVSSGSNRVYVTLDEIPENLQHAFVAIEDERFYEHNGIDLQGIARAGVNTVLSGSLSEGASTITQQLLKNNVFEGWTSETTEESIKRKLQEQYLAIELEKEVSKDWIMENYLNTINLGQNTLGVQAASNRYFGKDVSELTLSECAVIAAITQNPSKYNPISYPENNRERQEKVLQNMMEQGYITQEEYEEAIADDVYARISEHNVVYESDTTNVTSYFVDALTEQVIEDLQTELGYTESQAYTALYSGGLTIYSTQDPEIQEICDDVINDNSNYDISEEVSFSYELTIQTDDGSVENYSEQTMLTWLKAEKSIYSLNFSSEEEAMEAIDEYREAILLGGGTVLAENVTYTVQPQASMTVIDQSTGEVKALVGGRGEKTASKTLNRASDTTAQPGSTFKILTTYAPALDQGLITLATTMVDEEITYANGKTVNNADGKYRGTVTIRKAIKDSINVIAIKTSRELTIAECYQSALDFGITTLTDEDEVEALPLGGITDGVTNLELTAAYAAIANGGVYHEPILYTKILDYDGNVLIDRTPETHRVIQETTAFLLTSAMEDVVDSGTGTLAGFSGMSIAGKTGTTSSTRASWFAGYTPYYTCAVWGGYDDNSELSSTTFTKNLWREAMSQIHEGLEDIGFEEPEGIVTCSVCTSTGLLASKYCTSVTTEYFTEGTEPTTVCSSHRSERVRICSVSGKVAGEYCPEEDVVTQYFKKDSETGRSTAPTEKCDVHTSETSESSETSDSSDTAGDSETSDSSGDADTTDTSGNADTSTSSGE